MKFVSVLAVGRSGTHWSPFGPFRYSRKSAPARFGTIWAAAWQNQQNYLCARRILRQPGHVPSVIRVFSVRMKKHCARSYPLSAQRSLWSVWADAQTDLSLLSISAQVILLVLICCGSYKSISVVSWVRIGLHQLILVRYGKSWYPYRLCTISYGMLPRSMLRYSAVPPLSNLPTAGRKVKIGRNGPTNWTEAIKSGNDPCQNNAARRDRVPKWLRAKMTTGWINPFQLCINIWQSIRIMMYVQTTGRIMVWKVLPAPVKVTVNHFEYPIDLYSPFP